MKICKYRGQRGECGDLPPVREGRDGFDLMCVPDHCERFTPLTNLDRVRALEIPDLIDILIDGCTDRISQEHCDRYDRDCSACWAAWLAAEAEEGA